MGDISKIKLPDNTDYDIKDAKAYRTTDGAETDLQDADYIPFYDNSASATKNTLWSNIKAKLKTYFDTLYTNNTGTVTSVATGVGLTGGTITGSGTIKAKLRSETKLTNDSAAATETSGRVYPVVQDKSGYLAVNVPWENTWKANSSSSEGYVASGSGQANKVWKTDADGNPAWRDDNNIIPSAYCNTAAGTAAKLASCTNYKLLSKSFIHVIVVNTNTSASAITLNINGQGAKPIYINGSASSASNYGLTQGSYLVYYDGTNYYFRTDGKLTANITGNAETATTATKLGSSDVGGSTTPMYLEDGVPTALEYTIQKSVPSDAVFTDTKVTSTSTNPSSITTYYPTWVSGSGTSTVGINNGFSYQTREGTTSDLGYGRLRLGNAIASGTDKNKKGQLWIYSDNDKYVSINYTSGATADRTFTIPAVTGIASVFTTTTLTSNQVVIVDGTSGGIKPSGYTIEKSVPSDADFNDTKNTAGSTNSSSKLFLIGATSQAANPQTYSHDTAYVGTDGHLYSDSKQVVNLSGSQALTNKTYNGYTLAAACAKAVVTSVDTSASLPTSNAVKTFVEGKGYVTTDTKNTAGSTDTSSKIFLIGATSQAANPQTYSDNEVYVTSGVLTTKSVQVGGTSATISYNSTTKSIDFTFA